MKKDLEIISQCATSEKSGSYQTSNQSKFLANTNRSLYEPLAFDKLTVQIRPAQKYFSFSKIVNNSIVCEVNERVFFFYKTYFKPKIHKTITSN